MSAQAAAEHEQSVVPARAGLVLLALILVAAVANLNLAVANVALPDIGKAFDASQTSLDLIAVGYSLGLAASVLWLGALGDRYGRKMMLILGVLLSIPACLLAAYAPNEYVLFLARLMGGFAAGMAYPTTLALITALWAGQPRTKSIALWSALGGAISALGPLVAGALARALLVGLGLSRHPPTRGGGARSGVHVRARARQRSDRAGRQSRRPAVDGVRGGADPRDQLRARFPTRGCSRSVSASSRWRGVVAFLLRQRRAPTRSTTSTSPAAASSGSRRPPASSCSDR